MRLLSRDIAPAASPSAPVRILQIGGGVFLRGFLDWMVDVANEKGAFGGSIAVALSTDRSIADQLRHQDMMFTVLVRGLRRGRPVNERRIVRSISDVFSLEQDWAHACAVASSPDLRAVVSNTTERGIVDKDEVRPAPGVSPNSFPARLAALLHARWNALGDTDESALLVLPCELIENNGAALRQIVLAHASRWGLAPGFTGWIERRVDFLATLVDRIVPGFPHEEADVLFADWGYEDRLAVAVEPFHLWAIEGDDAQRARLKLDCPGLDIVWTADLRPWRESKVRVLNGGHIATALAAFLGGHDTVRDMMDDGVVTDFLRRLIDRDILPFVPLPPDERRTYADAVLERFANPFARHALLSISVGAIGKWRIRILPSLLDQVARDSIASSRIAFSLAALIRFVRGEEDAEGWHGMREGQRYPIRDDDVALAAINAIWRGHEGDHHAVARLILADPTVWGQDLSVLPGLADKVARSLAAIEGEGVSRALARIDRPDAEEAPDDLEAPPRAPLAPGGPSRLRDGNQAPPPDPQAN